MKRRAKEFDRCYHSGDRVRFIRGLPCVVCYRQPSENAHIKNGGMGRKSAYTNIVPLCAFHHGQFDAWPAPLEDFEGHYMVDLTALAADTERLWQAHVQ